jgi:hypothetical protein
VKTTISVMTSYLPRQQDVPVIPTIEQEAEPDIQIVKDRGAGVMADADGAFCERRIRLGQTAFGY